MAKYFLRLIPTLTHHSDIPSVSMYWAHTYIYIIIYILYKNNNNYIHIQTFYHILPDALSGLPLAFFLAFFLAFCLASILTFNPAIPVTHPLAFQEIFFLAGYLASILTFFPTLFLAFVWHLIIWHIFLHSLWHGRCWTSTTSAKS